MSKTNKEEIYNLIQNHPEGLDDDDISKITGIEPRQQVQQLCTQLASVKRIRRESVDKAGNRDESADGKPQSPAQQTGRAWEKILTGYL